MYGYGRTTFVEMEVSVDQVGNQTVKISLPGVPREGEIITLPDDHYRVTKVMWHPHLDVQDPAKGFEWPDSSYYTLRLLVTKAYPKAEDEL